MGKISKARTTIGFFGGDLEPKEVTRLLGAQPYRAQRKGEARTLSDGERRVAREGSWLISYNQELDSTEIDEQIDNSLDRLTDHTAVWHDVTGRYLTRLWCGALLDSWNEGFELEESTLKRLADRDPLIGVDTYSPVDTWHNEQEVAQRPVERRAILCTRVLH